MFRFLHAADIHLDSPLRRLEQYEGAPAEAIRGATRRAFDNLVRFAIERQVDFILVAGDLYDGDWRDYNTGLFLHSRLQRLRDAAIPVYLISGNHDAANTMTRGLRLPEGTYRFPDDRPATVTLEAKSIAIHGQGFATAAVADDLSAGYPPPLPGYFNIGLLHTAASGREGHEPYAPCRPDDLAAKGYDYWALGHVHRREILNASPPIVFPGNLQGRHIRETGEKGCYLVEVPSPGDVRLQFQPMDVLRWEHCTVSADGTETVEALIDRIAEAVAGRHRSQGGMPLAVRITLEGESPAAKCFVADRQRWLSETRAVLNGIAGGEVWLETLRFREPTAIRHRIPDTPIGAADGPMAEIDRIVNAAASDPEHRSALAGSLKDLFRKLPGEWKAVTGITSPDDLGWLDERIREAHLLLSERLRPGDDEP